MDSLFCITTMLLNLSSEPMFDDKRDNKALVRASYVCYNDDRYKDQPCLKYFIKSDVGVYNVICGFKEKR